MAILKFGVDFELEEEADRILSEGRRGVTKHSEMKDYLSPSQLERRRAREITNKNGFPEAGLFQGLAKRAYAPGRDKGPRDLRLEDRPTGLDSGEMRRRLG